MNRAQLLRRALVGATVITFGELPETLAKIPGAQVAPAAAARTAVPTAARLVGNAVLLEDESHPLYIFGSMEGDPNLTALVAQRVTWLGENKKTRWPEPVLGNRETLAVLPPQGGRFFQADDIVRANGTGDCYLVGSKRVSPDVLALTYIGVSGHDVPIIDPRTEAKALHELLPKREPQESHEDRMDRERLETFGIKPPGMRKFEDERQRTDEERRAMRSYDEYLDSGGLLRFTTEPGNHR